MRQSGLAALCDKQTRILIVGTFPSQKSLALRQYYANPQNTFWKIIGGVLGTSLDNLNYAQKIQTLLSSGIGLWDAIESCHRDGSMDHKIIDPHFNDIQSLGSTGQSMRLLVCNGKLAATFLEGRVTLQRITMPSSSPANTGMPLAKKIELWSAALEKFL